ncbi:L,D-transpeptidase [Granulicella tundricola]|uniref:ErfK/YbiS/YcfS/YnhG family protein n=1 Tax=Granulicella tundricola (strain ATCC BAA-1859 / DSM 23138 / MP5ACTX9) TaxID=1198114 RepID=E8X7C1_GRATM|nr:L,D-transpeptidase [Granulicella tundricola]ADW71355.1 ErfK/YbiS/YcfS/YnhG family protein [Granulicella tundricola MP5ACTX9]
MNTERLRRRFLRNFVGALICLGAVTGPSWAQSSNALSSDLAGGIEALKPGQYLWAPMVAPSGPVLAVISLKSQRVYVYRNGVLIGVATVSTGKPGHQTPTGVFTVLQKKVHHKSNLYDSAPMPYMERLTWSGVAMHAGNLPGYPASHGCIRMPMAFAKLLYGTTARGMTVVITELDEVPRFAPVPDLLQSEASSKAEDAGGAIWAPQKSSSGPVSLILSAADHRLVVLRNGVLIGSTPVTVTGAVTETTAYSLSKVDTLGYHWVQLPLPGQSWVGTRELPISERSRVTMPDAFRSALDAVLSPGVTLVVTSDSLLASGTGKSLTVIESEP